MIYDNFNPVHMLKPIPSFETDIHIVTSCTSHKDLWTFTSKKDSTKSFCITSGLKWIESTCRPLDEGALPLLDHFKKPLGMNYSHENKMSRRRTRFD